MFLAKKLLSMFFLPLPIFFLFLSVGLYYLHKNSFARAKAFVYLSLIWLFLFSYSPFPSFFLDKLEHIYPQLSQVPKSVKFIHVLGSGHDSNPSIPLASQMNKSGLVRIIEGVTLYKQIPHLKLIFSGYGKNDPKSNAKISAEIAISLGVKPEDIILLETPRDTYEEALQAKSTVNDDQVILVTSASHMSRAVQLFNKAGVSVIPAPTDFLVKTHETLWQFPSVEGLERSERLFHEYLGILWGKLTGIL